MPAPEAPPKTAPTTSAAMMGTAKRREGAVPSGPADVDTDAGLDAGPDAGPGADDVLDEDLDGGIDAATDGAEAATEEDALEERGLRVG